MAFWIIPVIGRTTFLWVSSAHAFWPMFSDFSFTSGFLPLIEKITFMWHLASHITLLRHSTICSYPVLHSSTCAYESKFDRIRTIIFHYLFSFNSEFISMNCTEWYPLTPGLLSVSVIIWIESTFFSREFLTSGVFIWPWPLISTKSARLSQTMV